MKLQIHKDFIKGLIDEYTTITEEDDDYTLSLKNTLLQLDKADLIIFLLYTHYQSERRTAKALGVSRTPIHRLLNQIREKLKQL